MNGIFILSEYNRHSKAQNFKCIFRHEKMNNRQQHLRALSWLEEKEAVLNNDDLVKDDIFIPKSRP